MRFSARLTALLGVVSALASASLSASAEDPPRDIAGSRDHPLLGRFPGAVIRSYKQTSYDEVGLPDAPVPQQGSARLFETAGRVTRIGYSVDSATSVAELAHNYAQALDDGHFVKVFNCRDDACGQDFGALVINSGKVMPPSFPSEFGNTNRAYLGKRSGPDGDAYVFLYLMDDSDSNHKNYVYEEIVEPKPVDARQIKIVDAQSLKSQIDGAGRVALYGLYFDTDKADVKPDSAPQLAEMARLLTDNPTWQVYVVGHTDNQGSFAHNIALSQARAEAIVKALSTTYKISPTRLSARGVASLAPVASNTDESGKAKNRRVELVLQ